MTITKTFDFDPNISVSDLFKFLTQNNLTLISLNQQPNLPLPSITISFDSSRLETLKKIFN